MFRFVHHASAKRVGVADAIKPAKLVWRYGVVAPLNLCAVRERRPVSVAVNPFGAIWTANIRRFADWEEPPKGCTEILMPFG